MVMADRYEELETFDNLHDIFASWEQLGNKNIMGPVTSPKPLVPEFKREGDFPVAEKVANLCLSLPMSPYLNTQDQSQVNVGDCI